MTVIKTERLLLRPPTRDDAPRFVELCNDIDIARNTARIPHPYTADDAAKFLGRRQQSADEEHVFAVTRNDEIVACAGAAAKGGGVWEIGYWVGAAWRGDGVATEAAGAVTQFVFEAFGAALATAGWFTDNPASGRVLEKIGFRPTGERVMTHSVGRGGETETARAALRREDFVRLQKWLIEISP